MSNKWRTTLYTGVTSNLPKRVYEHKNGLAEGFSKKYRIHSLVYFEIADEMAVAIEREKQIKSGSHARKIALIESMNPEWRDLSEDI